MIIQFAIVVRLIAAPRCSSIGVRPAKIFIKSVEIGQNDLGPGFGVHINWS